MSSTPLSSYFSHDFKVYYEDTDSGGIVYYANYLKFAERGRTEALRELNISQADLAKKDGIFFIVKSCNINFIKPARLDDTLIVKTLFKKVQQTSALVVQTILSQGVMLAELEVVIVAVKKSDESLTLSPVRIPLDIAQKLRANRPAPKPLVSHGSVMADKY